MKINSCWLLNFLFEYLFLFVKTAVCMLWKQPNSCDINDSNMFLQGVSADCRENNTIPEVEEGDICTVFDRSFLNALIMFINSLFRNSG